MNSKKKTFKIVTFENKTLSWWYTKRDKIDMDPSYQRRGRLWSQTDKAFLIDSILNGYDVPKIYIADFTWRDSPLNVQKLPYAIIDGKQRLEAIFDFFESKVVLNKDFVFLEDTSKALGGLGFRDLKRSHSEVAENFENWNLVVVSVIAESDEPINELFVRLNRSKSLTGAEIRNAMRGPAPAVIRELSRHDFFETNVRFSNKRGADLNAAAKILLFEYNGGVHETKKRNLDAFVLQLSDATNKNKLELAARRVFELLSELTQIFLPGDELLGSAGMVPVYYWFIRNLEQDSFPFVREFLVEFEQKRRENRDLVQTSPTDKKIDTNLVEYDRYNRSTNDQTSHTMRVVILSTRFKVWLESRSKKKAAK